MDGRLEHLVNQTKCGRNFRTKLSYGSSTDDSPRRLAGRLKQLRGAECPEPRQGHEWDGGQALNPFLHLSTNGLNLPKCLTLLIAVHFCLGNIKPQPGQGISPEGPVVQALNPCSPPGHQGALPSPVQLGAGITQVALCDLQTQAPEYFISLVTPICSIKTHQQSTSSNI
jgi:hypothetical protein